MRTAQRQHINLSQRAYDTITSDIAALMPNESISGFINRVFLSFHEEASASVSLYEDRAINQLQAGLKISRYISRRPKDKSLTHFRPDEIVLSEADEEIIRSIVSGRMLRLQLAKGEKQKGVVLKIRLQNEVFDILYPSDLDNWPESSFYKSQGDYIKAVIEEYADLSFFEREAVLFKSLLSVFSSEISLPFCARRILTITHIGQSGRKTVYDFKIYDLVADTGSNYHYVVGLSKRAKDTGDSYKITSFRVSRIEDSVRIKPKSSGSGKLTKYEQKEIQEALSSRGVQYLLEESSLFKVCVSKNGLRLFNGILHMRPHAIDIRKLEDGKAEITLECTEKQLVDYFFKFGEDAIILDNPALADSFRQRYLAAEKAYESLQYTQERTEGPQARQSQLRP